MDSLAIEDTATKCQVIILYRSRLFRDVVARILRDAPDIAIAGITRRRREALHIAGEHGVQSLVVETNRPVQQERGLLEFLCRLTSANPDLRVVALSLSESGASVYAWRKLNYIGADQLVAEVSAP
jgi:chemotaxis response regulator CheB